jgi:hypothetical protein
MLMSIQLLGVYTKWMLAVLDITEVHAASIFRVEVCRVGVFVCTYKFMFWKNYEGNGDY